MSLAPKCCKASLDHRTVILFIPAPGQGAPINWVAPMRLADEDTIAARCSVPVAFCPFCGTKLGIEHVPFEPNRPETPDNGAR